MTQNVWLNDLSQQFLERDYLTEGQTAEQRIDDICQNAERILNKPGFAEAFKANFAKGWYSFSTPVWTNFGQERGLPISCFGSYIDDTMESILGTHAEVGMMTKMGGGTSGYFGALRKRGSTVKNNGESYGSVHFMQLYDMAMNIISQGSTRRGSFAGYQDIDHGDIEEFLTIRSEGSPIQDMSFGVSVPDYWMEEMIAGDADKRRIWAKVLQSRANTGYPYIFFSGNANKGAADVYKKEGMKIHHSNLCTEIMLPNKVDESFVCCLSSMNILYYDDWKNSNAVELMTYFLDAVMSEFITKAKKIPFMDRAVRFAERHRAIGIGWFGWASYLQSKMIPWESDEAKIVNSQIARKMKKNGYAASAKMAEEYGEPEVLKGYGRRHTTMFAIAPTKSSAFIIGQASEGIEPDKANVMIKDLAKGKYTIKNKYLEALLESKGENTPANWDKVLKNAGSVKTLDCLTEEEKAVFKTFREISPDTIIELAADRQKHIDQGQSINLLISPTTPIKEVNALYIKAWKLGVKSLYYQISVNAAQEFTRALDNCVACEA